MPKNLLFIILTSIFVNNYVLTKFLGVCPFLGVSKKALSIRLKQLGLVERDYLDAIKLIESKAENK